MVDVSMFKQVNVLMTANGCVANGKCVKTQKVRFLLVSVLTERTTCLSLNSSITLKGTSAEKHF